MDRYEELENEVSRRLLEYRNEFEAIKKEIANTDDDIDEWRLLSKKLQNCLDNLGYAERRLISLKAKEQEVREMLEGFYDDGYSVHTLVYTPIYKISSYEPDKYRVRNKYFTTLKEAKEYSISLGERKNWLEHAYIYL